MTLAAPARLKIAYVALAAADSWLAGSGAPRAHRARLVTKPLLMPTLAVSLVTNRRARTSPLRTTTLGALAFGWVGDLALLGRGTGALAAGTGSFGIGHAAYVSGLLLSRNLAIRIQDRTGARIAAGIWATSAPVMALGAYREEPALGPAVLGYTALLCGTLAASTNLDPRLPASSRRLAVAGAVLFVASDATLGLRRFWWKSAPARIETLVMTTYTAAQLLLAEGAVRAVPWQPVSTGVVDEGGPGQKGRPRASPAADDPGRRGHRTSRCRS
ncbi:MAG: lysoplasmalogenase [Actinomycetota bacterium]|nr:lysoplasmalogenase [Actinomycetota bacterium]